MRSLVESMNKFVEAKWSKDVETKWTPPEGFFKKSADDIASGLKAASKNLAQAMERLNFYVNRAGKNLSSDDKARLEAAKEKLSELYASNEEEVSEHRFVCDAGDLEEMKMPSKEDLAAGFAALEKVLRAQKLPTATGDRQADAGEFMMMPSPREDSWAFKHSDTRNMLYVNKATGALEIPKNPAKPFEHGEFDVSPAVSLRVSRAQIGKMIGKIRMSAGRVTGKEGALLKLIEDDPAALEVFEAGVRAVLGAALATAGAEIDSTVLNDARRTAAKLTKMAK